MRAVSFSSFYTRFPAKFCRDDLACHLVGAWRIESASHVGGGLRRRRRSVRELPAPCGALNTKLAFTSLLMFRRTASGSSPIWWSVSTVPLFRGVPDRRPAADAQEEASEKGPELKAYS
ncbi:unnamed protein product [Symbiodinium sp. CCMP2592]|nr:unnamed protein product [Symbiodinium sp. CCMP2592]